MIVMPSNNTGIVAGFLAGKFPGKIGHLYSPGGQRGPHEFVPYSLDNGAFGAAVNNAPWSREAWVNLLEWSKASGQSPRWVLVPDVVGDRAATINAWREHCDFARSYEWPLAFAVQDGMTPRDVPLDADVVFVGGSTEWKWNTVAMWCSSFPRVHVGRVNTYRRLWQCHDDGAESTDGTGFFRGDKRQLEGLVRYLEESTGARGRDIQHGLNFAA